MNRRHLKLCLDLLKGNWLPYLGSIIAMLCNVALGFASPLVLGWTIDSFIGQKPLDAPAIIVNFVEKIGGTGYVARTLWICSLALLTISCLNGVISFCQAKWSSTASENIAKSLRDRMYDHIQSLSYNYHVKVETGDLLQRCSSDVETVRRFLSAQLMQIVRAVALVSTALAILLPLSGKMTFIAIVSMPPIFLFSAFYFKKVIATFRDADYSEGALSATLQENLSGMRVVRAFGTQHHEIDKFEERCKDFRDKIFKVNHESAKFWSISDGMAVVQRALLLCFGIFEVVRGNITVGTLTIFYSYENQLMWPVRQLGRTLADMGKATVALERIDEVLRQKPESHGEENKVAPELDKEIVFENVKFAYEKDKPVLDGISFTAKPGETVAILGATGSGKSTLMYLLQRLYDYDSGSIKIGGVELRDIDKKHLRTHVGIVLQEPFLYSKTIRENIAITNPDMKDEEIFEAARTAAVHDVINEFENGYETMVGEKGVTLSGGQKQRVSIARTLLKDNDILIFDDSLSAVDTETDAQIRKALSQRTKQTTTFIIAHRITTLMQADKILVLENGKVAQNGTHKELIEQDGLYRRIFNIQTSLEEELQGEVAS